MFVGQAATAALEREAQGLVDRFEEQNPKYTVEREAIPPDQVRQVIQTRLHSGAPDYFSYDTGPGFGGVLRIGAPVPSGESLRTERVGYLRLGEAAGHLRGNHLWGP